MRRRGAGLELGLSLILATAACDSAKMPGGAAADAAEADGIDAAQSERSSLPDAILLLCGNAVLDQGETCDDGNRAGGDGCSQGCRLEERAVCAVAGQPCHVAPPCGDGVVGAGEVCDDGNGIGGDGCAADCAVVEPGWRCVVPGRRCLFTCAGSAGSDGGVTDGGPGCGPSQCGDGIVSGGEECDDGAANADGIYGGCTTRCTYGGFCGDAVMNGPEVCDLGTAANRGSYGEPSGCTPRCLAAPYCGDARIDQDAEQCDQGSFNGAAGSSCNKSCKLVLP
jgi:cysteine-rich repeat protein